MGWDVPILDGVFVYGMGCLYTGWGVSIRNGGVSIWGGVLVYEIGC